jgi:hypothetical protein
MSIGDLFIRVFVFLIFYKTIQVMNERYRSNCI